MEGPSNDTGTPLPVTPLVCPSLPLTGVCQVVGRGLYPVYIPILTVVTFVFLFITLKDNRCNKGPRQTGQRYRVRDSKVLKRGRPVHGHVVTLKLVGSANPKQVHSPYFEKSGRFGCFKDFRYLLPIEDIERGRTK